MTLKWVIGSNVVSEILKFLQEIIWTTLEYIGIGNNFLNRTPTAQQLRQRIDKQECMKLKSFCTAKEMVTGLKSQPTE
jgi:hypothetical protein